MHSKLSETISFHQNVASIVWARKVLFVMFSSSTWNMQKHGPPLQILKNMTLAGKTESNTFKIPSSSVTHKI